MSETKIRKQARMLMWLITVPFTVLVLLASLLIGNLVWQGATADGKFVAQIAWGVFLYYLPMAFYMWAIWMVRRALKSISAGEMFSEVVPQILTRVGIALFCGALFKEVGVPLLNYALEGGQSFGTFEASAITLGIIGASLVLFAQLLGRAATSRRELDEFL